MITDEASKEQLLNNSDIQHFHPDSGHSSMCLRGLSLISALPKGRFHICTGVFDMNSSSMIPSTSQSINHRNHCYCVIKHLMSRKGHSSRSKFTKTP